MASSTARYAAVRGISRTKGVPATRPDRLLLYNLLAGGSHLFTFVMMAAFFGGFRQFRLLNFEVLMMGRSTNTDTFVTTPLFQTVGYANVVVFIAAFPLLTQAFHFLEAAWAPDVLTMIRTGAHWLRWVEYSISAPTMLVALALGCGVSSLGELVGIFGNYLACMILGGAAEWFLVAGGDYGRTASVGLTVASFLTFFAAWIPVSVSFFFSIGNAGPDVNSALAFIYVAYFMLLAFNLAFPAVFLWKMYRLWTVEPLAYLEEHAERFEIAYVTLSFASKMGLAWNIFGSSFQIQHPDDVAVIDPGFSHWILMVFLVTGLVWFVAAATAWIKHGSLDYLAGALPERAPGWLGRTYPPALALAAFAEIAHIVLAVIDLSDYTDFGWAAALVLAIHITCEALYFAAADRALADPALAKYLRAVLWISFLAYTAFVVVTAVYASSVQYQVAFGVLGGFVGLYLGVFDAFLYPIYAVPA